MPSPPTPSDFSDIAQRFAAAGVIPPAERAAGTYANAQRLLSVLHWLRQPRTVAAEPANIFTLVPREPQ